MLCQKCKSKQANMFFKQTINGKTTQLAFCEDCAAESGIGIDFGFGKTASSGFIGSVFDALNDGNMRLKKEGDSAAVKRCPLCGSSFSNITSSGKVGCARCYETFAPELSGTLAGIHGNVQHIGRKPNKRDLT